MDLRGYLLALRKSWWIVVLILVLGGAAGFAKAHRSTKIYAAHISFYVSTPASASNTALGSDQFAQDRATSYAKLLSGDRLANLILEGTSLPSASGKQMTTGQLASDISGSADLNTVIVSAEVKNASASRALVIAKALATDFPAMIKDLESSTYPVNLEVVSGPTVGSSPVSPRTKLDLLLGAGIGLLIGLLIAVMRQLLDTSVRTTDALEDVMGAPILGNIGRHRDARKSPLLVGLMRSIRAEEFRRIRTNLQFIDAAKSVRAFAITSSLPAEGKSTTSINLAIVFAEGGSSVLLIEAELRRPRFSQYLGIEGGVGLTSVLAGQVLLTDAVQPWGDHGLSVLPSGAIPPNPSELLATSAMHDLLAEARQRYDLVIIDTPPVLPVTDAAVLSSLVDGFLVVFRYGKTKRSQIAHTMQSLAAVDARILGGVLNMRPLRGPMSDGYGAYGYYSDQKRGLFGGRIGATAHAGVEPPEAGVPETDVPQNPPSPDVVDESNEADDVARVEN